MFDVIVLGATFAAAGIVEAYEKNCLVLERRMDAGSEFYSALALTSEPVPFCGDEACRDFANRFEEESPTAFGRDAVLYPIFQKCRTIFATELVCVRRTGDGFLCSTHGVNGFSEFEAKRIVDTRTHERFCISKSFNLLIESPETPEFDGVSWKRIDCDGRYVLHCPVPPSGNLIQARKITLETVRKFSPSQKLILSANEFDYTLTKQIPKEEDGILLLPSKAYEHPVSAFEAGAKLRKEMKK